MSIGNILSALESHFGPLSAESLTEHWGAGDLERLRPDGHWWLVELDTGGGITSAETLPSSEIEALLPQKSKRTDVLVTRQRQPDGSPSLSVRLIPAYLRSETFQ